MSVLLALPIYTTTFKKLSQMTDGGDRFTYRPDGLEAWGNIN